MEKIYSKSKNKKRINEVIIVEGKSDIAKLKSIINADFIDTNGSSISRETLDYIKEIAKSRTIIILTDPDYPGMQIRNKIQAVVPNAKHAFVDRQKSIKGKKLGVAECLEEEIIRALESVVSFDNSRKTDLISEADLFKLGLNGTIDSGERRKLVYDNFHLGFGNAKTLRKRLNSLGITFKEIEDFLSTGGSK